MNTNVCFKTSFKRSLCLSLFGQRNQTPQTHGVSVILKVLQFIVPFLATSGAEITHFTLTTLKIVSYAIVITLHLQHQSVIPQQTL